MAVIVKALENHVRREPLAAARSELRS
jgi:hypothetical protein